MIFEENKAMKQILIINGHPVKDSYCSVLANSYEQGAKIGKYTDLKVKLWHSVQIINFAA